MKPIRFLGTVRRDPAAFPRVGTSTSRIRVVYGARGREPAAFKPLPPVGSGVYEIRIEVPTVRSASLYVAKFEEAVYVLHSFSEEDPKDVPGGHQIGSRALQVNRRAAMKKKRARQVKRANNVFLCFQSASVFRPIVRAPRRCRLSPQATSTSL